MALLKFISGIRLRAALVKCGITLAVALLDLTAGVILTTKKVAIRAWEAHSDSGRTSTMYLHGRRVVREVCFLEQQISRQHMCITSHFCSL